MKRGDSKTMSDDFSQLQLRVLGYKSDDGKWAAHCLETDLVGYGKTFRKAVDDLIELTEMQISFAFKMEQPSLLYHPAPLHIIESYHNLVQLTLQSYTMKRKVKRDQKVASLPLPLQSNKPDHPFVQA